MDDQLQKEHPDFQGNWDDLEHFMHLARSRIRSAERSKALDEWSKYKLDRQLSCARDKTGKGSYIKALTARVIDLRGANLDNICVGYVDLRGAWLDKASLRGAWLKGANLENASLKGAKLCPAPQDGYERESRLLWCDLRRADLEGADLRAADLSQTRLHYTNLRNATLTSSNLQDAVMIYTDLRGADLSGSLVYGVSPWNIHLDDTPDLQRDLIITPPDEAPVQVDYLEIAQFTYLLLQNPNIRKVIDTITRRGVLILGRFTPERKRVLDALRSAIREYGLVPMLFDFDRPETRDFTETIVTLAGLSQFVIADITNPKSAPLELQATMPVFQIPFVPIIARGEQPFSMFADLVAKHGKKYGGHMMELREYVSEDALIRNLGPQIIAPARALAEDLALRKGNKIEKIVLD